jgi:hypothetical protein
MSGMLLKKICLLALLLALMPATPFAGGDAQDTHAGLAMPGLGQSQFSGAGQGLSLLDPQLLDISQSYGLVYSTDGRNGDLIGLYQNLLSYRLSPRLNLKFNLGYYHQPFAASSAASGLNRQALMTAFQLDFQPFDNVFIRFDYQSLPAIDYRNSFWR